MPAIIRQTTQETGPYNLRRNTARRSQPLPDRFERIRNTIDTAITNRYQNNEHVYTGVMYLQPQDIILYTRENTEVFRCFYNARQHQAHYQIGFALNLLRETTGLSEAEAAVQLDITDVETRRARRTYYLFRL
jgi:hypothetical protein